MASETKKLPTMSDADLAAMIAAKDAYKEILGGKAPKESKELFYAGFHFGVAYARGEFQAPEEQDGEEGEEDADG